MAPMICASNVHSKGVIHTTLVMRIACSGYNKHEPNTDGPTHKIGPPEFSKIEVHSYADRMGARKLLVKSVIM